MSTRTPSPFSQRATYARGWDEVRTDGNRRGVESHRASSNSASDGDRRTDGDRRADDDRDVRRLPPRLARLGLVCRACRRARGGRCVACRRASYRRRSGPSDFTLG